MSTNGVKYILKNKYFNFSALTVFIIKSLSQSKDENILKPKDSITTSKDVPAT